MKYTTTITVDVELKKQAQKKAAVELELYTFNGLIVHLLKKFIEDN